MQTERSLKRHLLWAMASTSALSLVLLPMLANAAFAGGALPAGGQYVAGKGSIGGDASSLVVRQSSTTGIIDWNNFSIGKGDSVMFENGSGATLNEVTGGTLSTIAGSLQASGSVYLINQSGVIVSGSGRIVTGGSFGASTGDDPKRGDIVDAGRIQSLHGNVSLSAANVSVSGAVAVMRGGQLWLTSIGTTTVSGSLAADNAKGAGGTIVATGRRVDVAGTANLSASGASEGGTILIGGDVHGGAVAAEDFVKTAIADAQTTTVAQGATLSANASQGAGGDIVIWSDGHTSYDGTISARGKTAGGFAEVSSHDLLGFEGTADLESVDGKTGTLLLDPENVTIESATTTGGSFSGGSPNIFTPTADNSILDVSDLEAALASANVHVTTGSTGSQAGTITVVSPFTWTSSNGLELDAAGSIVFDAAVTGTNAILYLIAGSTVSSNSSGVLDVHELRVASNGAVTLNAANAIGVLGPVTTGNGDFALTNGQTLPVDGAVDAGAGAVTLTTTGANDELGIQAALTGATVDLVSSGSLISSAAGIITAGTLTGSSVGETYLNAANQVSNLGAFATTNSPFELTNAGSLTVAGAVDTGTGNIELRTTSDDLVIDAALTGATVDLVSAGTVTQDGAGIITATTLTGASQGAAILTANNAIKYLEAFGTNDSNFSLTDSKSLETAGVLNTGAADISLVTTGSNSALEVARALTAGTATLQASGNVVVDATLTATTLDTVSDQNMGEGKFGVIIVTTLTGSSVGDSNFDQTNLVQDLGTFATGGGDPNANTLLDLKVANSLTVIGTVTAPGDINLTTTGSGSNLLIDAPMSTGFFELYSAGTISQDSAGILTSTRPGGFEGSSVGDTTLNAQNDLNYVNNFTTNNANFSLTNAAPLTVQLLMTGNGTLSLTTTGAGNNLIIEGSPASNGTVNLTSGAEVTETSNAGVTANLLNVVANTGITLTSDSNDITTIGTDTTNSGPNEINQH